MNLLNSIGDWNPQLLRELKGRLKLWNIVGAIALSLIGQFLFMLTAYARLPLALASLNSEHPYCTGSSVYETSFTCLRDSAGNFLFNWTAWWRDNFLYFDKALLFCVIVAGVYLLISNLGHEERQGTLGFVRLSPRSNREILIGKVLGVPSLVYLALACALPLHLWMAVQGQVAFGAVVATYLTGLLGTLCFFSTALLWSLTTTLFGNLQAWIGAGFMVMMLTVVQSGSSYLQPEFAWYLVFNPSLVLDHLTLNRSLQQELAEQFWFNLPFRANLLSCTLFSCGFFGVWIYWLWQGLDRRFRSPNATVLSKRQSYGFTACFQLSLMGFLWDNKHSYSLFGGNLAMPIFTSLMLFVLLIFVLTPNQQQLQEWARYRHGLPKQERRSLLSDLIWGEKSPALLAIALNLVLGLGIFLICILVPASADTLADLGQGFWFAVHLSGVVLVLAAVFQVVLMMRLPRRSLWAASVLGVLLFVPAVAVQMTFPSNAPAGIWLLTAFPWLTLSTYSSATASAFTMMMGAIAQMSAFGLLTYRLQRQLQQAGRSQTQAMLASL
ncbi:MAG: hypothetical protein MUF49_28725 [Oculatellaceae cyanobacterium Prado106]|jgi:hypothetical protein|nr:hypothetical protein [Oculatellaceae cyanobacterium Prado106]